MKISTRDRIINTAIKLFNKKGYASVTLHGIAGEMNMTRGNLTYHFKDKDQLLKEITDGMWEAIMKQRNKSRQLPSFENLHNEVQLYHKLQQQYSFLFLDTHIVTHPLIKERFRQMTEQTIKDNKAAIAFAIASGNMQQEPYKGIYHNIAFNTWMLAFYWRSQKIIRGEKNKENAEAMIWSMLIPHFTKKGMKAFITFFGKDYLDNLGESFEDSIENYISF